MFSGDREVRIAAMNQGRRRGENALRRGLDPRQNAASNDSRTVRGRTGTAWGVDS